MVSYLRIAIASSAVITAWECYLMYRQKRAHKRGTPKPADVDLTDEAYEAIREYTEEKVNFSILSHVKQFVECVVVTLGAPKSYALTHELLVLAVPSSVANLQYGGFAHGWAFCVAFDILDTILGLPLSIYSTFWIEAKHGFNKTTKTEFAKDVVKMFLLRVLALHPLMVGLLHGAVAMFGENFPLYMFGAASALLMVATYVIPAVIQPMFNKFTPLPEGTELETEVRRLAKTLEFPLTKMYVMDGSRRSGHSNAYFYGFWKSKRIVFFDTLLDQMNVQWDPSNNATKSQEGDDKDEEKKVRVNCGVRGALAVLCHEFGHWKMNHTMYMLGMSLGQLFSMCYGAKYFMFHEPIFIDFGFAARDVGNPLIGFQLFTSVVMEPLMTFVMYGMCAVTRKFEFEADEFAVNQGYGEELQEALKVLQEENKSSVTPDWLYSALHYTHPPMRQRLAAIRNLVARREKKAQ